MQGFFGLSDITVYSADTAGRKMQCLFMVAPVFDSFDSFDFVRIFKGVAGMYFFMKESDRNVAVKMIGVR